METTQGITLVTLLDEVAQVRDTVETLKSEITALETELATNPIYQTILALKEAKKQAQERQESVETLLRQSAVVKFQLTGDKNVLPGVQIKEFEVVRITDERAAIKWAAENIPAAVQLKRSDFDKVVKVMGDTPFAVVETEPRAQIATNLKEILGP